MLLLGGGGGDQTFMCTYPHCTRGCAGANNHVELSLANT